MKGEKINNLCKALAIMDEHVYMNEKVKVVDPPHVMLMEVESLDGSAVFEVTDNRLLDPKDILAMKIEDREDFDVLDENNEYTLRNEERYYSVPIMEDGGTPRSVRVPKLDLHKVEVSGKMLKLFIKGVLKSCDTVTLLIKDGEVWIEAENSFQKVGMKLATTYRDINVRSGFATDYMKKWIKVAGSVVTLGLDTDHPMTAEWSDNYYKYKVLLAPRIERDD